MAGIKYDYLCQIDVFKLCENNRLFYFWLLYKKKAFIRKSHVYSSGTFLCLYKEFERLGVSFSFMSKTYFKGNYKI